MRFSQILSSALLLAVARAADDAAAESDVISLTATDFTTVVDPEPLILVEFFAPWCGHCKALAPHYEEAATALKAKNIKIAKVDCVDQADLCQTHGVQGYPTLKVFRNGTPTDYTGPRKADGIISYMVKQSLPAVTDVTAANHAEFKAADRVVVIAYATASSDAAVPVFSQVAEKHRDDYLFGLSTDAAAISEAGVTPPAVVLYRKFDEPKLEFGKATFTAEELEEYLKTNSMPLVDEVGPENYATYANSGLPLAYLFVEPSDPKHAEYVDALKPSALKYKGKLNFVYIDAVKFADHGKALNLAGDKWPAFVIQDMTGQFKYPLENNDITADVISGFSDLFVEGKIKPKLKSQPVPEVQDESVYNLVGSEFEKVVLDDDKDVFVEFYATWCGHCKRLKPTWDSLGDKYADIKDRITIAKMEATENDLPGDTPFRVTGFPTLKFKKAGTREFLDYEGDRSLESLIEFVEATAVNPLDASVPFKGKKAPAEEAVPTESEKVAQPTEEAHAEPHDEL
ncbi:protein disulfide isomerase [Exidia glandulosa HHB12029]|uniref:Protein disulfide-isomerase n=1 Tax=Exidia glandulosa HHB12029 TaxID=1314781 RepID=A0A165QYD1_EXIGL|nr:protein disulfide isomerase [Exidia glandulosa HHB12029]